MYLSTRTSPTTVTAGATVAQTSPLGGKGGRTSRIVSTQLVGLGLTSMLTDVSSEMVTAVVPLYLTASLGFTIVGFALVDAGQQFLSAVLRFWSGPSSDHRRNYKGLAGLGYGVSAVCRVGMLIGGIGTTTAALWADRVGKGIRVAPRDAMIAEAAPPGRGGLAFGIHRAFDTAGAMIGPLLAAYVLHEGAGSYDSVFAVAAAAAIAGLLVLYAFVRSPRVTADRTRSRLTSAAKPRLDRKVWHLAVTAALLGLITVPDGMIYLAVAPDDPADFALLIAGGSFMYLVASVPMGWLADRFGPRRVLLLGYAALFGLYAIGAASTGRSALLCAGLLGLYYAASDGVLAAFAARFAGDRPGTAIALVTGSSIIGRCVASIAFALMWTRIDDLTVAFTVLAIAVVVVVPVHIVD